VATEDSTLSVRQQAASWWTLLHEGEVSAAEREQFSAWIMRSPGCIEAYLEMERLMRALKRNELRWPEASVQTLIQEAKSAPPEPVRLLREPSSAENRSQGWRHPRWRWSAAAGIALLAVAGSLAWLLPHHYSTGFGERRSILLADGSRVTLDSASSISVDFSRHHRDVRLLKGEALFQVTHDAQKPFDVHSDQAVIRAIGTSFNVDVSQAMTTVTVLEGRVAVMKESSRAAQTGGADGPQAFPAPADALILAAAERVVITAEGARVPERVANAAAATSWIRQRFVFDHLPLGEVTEELNRYTRVRIRIDSPDLQRREVSGVIQLDDPEAFLSFLSSVPDVTISQAEDGTRVVGLRE
jgi:transmembrane sensor